MAGGSASGSSNSAGMVLCTTPPWAIILMGARRITSGPGSNNRSCCPHPVFGFIRRPDAIRNDINGRWTPFPDAMLPVAAGAACWNFRPNHAPGQCLDISAGSTANGGNVQQWTCNGLEPQQFSLTPYRSAYRRETLIEESTPAAGHPSASRWATFRTTGHRCGHRRRSDRMVRTCSPPVSHDQQRDRYRPLATRAHGTLEDPDPGFSAALRRRCLRARVGRTRAMATRRAQRRRIAALAARRLSRRCRVRASAAVRLCARDRYLPVRLRQLHAGESREGRLGPRSARPRPAAIPQHAAVHRIRALSRQRCIHHPHRRAMHPLSPRALPDAARGSG
ncbi:MAG: RICIN domain-containing protein [Lysobacter sp.]|nr:RICIN domain-containing protein [Lysobacter sp.]